jgi:hypothetical protein
MAWKAGQPLSEAHKARIGESVRRAAVTRKARKQAQDRLLEIALDDALGALARAQAELDGRKVSA